MSRIKGKNTTIELKMRKLLQQNKIKFEQHPNIFGNPDFLIYEKTLVFCDGDFWHGYKYNEKKKPSGKFWRNKIEGNMERDKKITRKLRYQGWSVIRFWEHDIEKQPDLCLKKLRRHMR